MNEKKFVMRFMSGQCEREGFRYNIALTNSFLECISFKFKSKGWKWHATGWPEKYSFIKYRNIKKKEPIDD